MQPSNVRRFLMLRPIHQWKNGGLIWPTWGQHLDIRTVFWHFKCWFSFWYVLRGHITLILYVSLECLDPGFSVWAEPNRQPRNIFIKGIWNHWRVPCTKNLQNNGKYKQPNICFQCTTRPDCFLMEIYLPYLDTLLDITSRGSQAKYWSQITAVQ